MYMIELTYTMYCTLAPCSLPRAQSSVKDYISHFEPLVVRVVKTFPSTSSHLLQQRALFLLTQLLQLKVLY